VNNYSVELAIAGTVTYDISAKTSEEAEQKAREIAKRHAAFAPQAEMGQDLQTACNPYHSLMCDIITDLSVSVDLTSPIACEEDQW
jgi:hypothetical protein